MGSASSGDFSFTTPAQIPAVCPNAKYRVGPSAHLTDCRAYEQVSEQDKNGQPVILAQGSDTAAWPVTTNGDAVAYLAWGGFADADWGGANPTMYYVARRTGNGWGSTSVVPRPKGQTDGSLKSTTVVRFSDDLQSSLISSLYRMLPGDTSGVGRGLYRKSNLPGGELIHWPWSETSSPVGVGGERDVRVTPDLEAVAFTDDAVYSSDSDEPSGSFDKVFHFDGAKIRVASRDLDNAPFMSSSTLGASIGSAGSGTALSEDGRYVFFTNPSSGDSRVIYRRDMLAGKTEIVSPSLRAAQDTTRRAKVFLRATADGNRVFFTSTERLTDDANDAGGNGDLYRYDIAEGTLRNLSAGTAGGTAANVQGLLATNDAGTRAYFAANGQVVPGQGTPTGPNLYLWEDDGSTSRKVRFIATVASQDNGNWAADLNNHLAQATPDGGSLIFQSRANITGFDLAGTTQVYLYDADAESESGDLVCVSCPSDTPSGSAWLPMGGININMQPSVGRTISVDGRRVFFTTRERHVDRDLNGSVEDTYVWDRSSVPGEALTGRLSLISSGSDPEPSLFRGASDDGANAFFLSSLPLVPDDIDALKDLYVARIGGGLEPIAAPPDCDDDRCQDPPAARPAAPPIGSSAAVGDGKVANATPRSRGHIRVKRLRKPIGTLPRMAIRVPAAGRIVVSGGQIRRSATTVPRAGTYTVRLRLRPHARKRLRARKSLRTPVRVSFVGSDGQAASKRISVAFKQSKKKRSQAQKGGR